MINKQKYNRAKLNNKKLYQTSNHIFSRLLILGLVFISALIAFRSNSQLIYTGLSKTDYFSSISSNYKFRQGLLENEKFIIAGSTDELKTTNFAEIDNHAFSIRYDGTSVWELASLLSPYAKTEAEKARIIYSWITFN